MSQARFETHFGIRMRVPSTVAIKAQLRAMMAPPAPTTKVLLIDDQLSVHKPWKLALMDKVRLVHAFSVDDALNEFTKNPDVALIVMDTCLGKGVSSVNVVPLIKKIRETYTGPIIAASSMWANRETLLRAGCSHAAEKPAVPAKVLQILKIE